MYVIRDDVDLFGVYPNSEYTITMKNEGEKYLDKSEAQVALKNIQIRSHIIASINIAGGIADFAAIK